MLTCVLNGNLFRTSTRGRLLRQGVWTGCTCEWTSVVGEAGVGEAGVGEAGVRQEGRKTPPYVKISRESKNDQLWNTVG
jgi:hypothetical protein